MWELLTETGLGSCLMLAAGLWLVLWLTLGRTSK